MARKLTKEEIANGVFIDGAQLEKISDDVAESYNTLELNSIEKKYQITQACFTDGYGGSQQNKVNVWFSGVNEPQQLIPPFYPIESNQPVKNTYRIKGYNDNIPQASGDSPNVVLWQTGMFFNKPVIILNWSLFIQGVDQFYTFEGEDEGGEPAVEGIRCNIQTKNFFEQRDRRYDELLLNNVVSLQREAFYGNSYNNPSALGFETVRFPVPPSEVVGWFAENHCNILLPEQSQAVFTVSLPVNRTDNPWSGEAIPNTFKMTSTITFLEEIE